MTTNTGRPVANNQSSLSVGNRGPLLLEDMHLQEKLAQFHRERIPERVVHARGAAAEGFFEVTHDVSALTCCDALRAPGTRTPVAVRFSTVVHPQGSPETLRDPRGFAVKFYTREGNWDIVGNNLPVFFIRDGIKFPDMVHAFKPNPISNVQEGWRILDFLSHHPESAHMIVHLLDDQGVPENYRRMNGFGVHAFKFINKAGRETLVKFHWLTDQGLGALDDAQAAAVGGANHSHATQDLYEAIQRGDFPSWRLAVQTMDPTDQDKHAWDPLDPTKIWPEDVYPLHPVGRMTLNRNPGSFFNGNEQLAFCPANVVPGVTYSDDKLLQTRIFSYADAQRYRLGANYLTLPANAPRCPFAQRHFDGQLNMVEHTSEVNYFPSRVAPLAHARPGPGNLITQACPASGARVKEVLAKEDNFTQAGQLYRSFDPARRARFVDRLARWICDPKTPRDVRAVWLGYWSECDTSLGRTLADLVRRAEAAVPSKPSAVM